MPVRRESLGPLLAGHLWCFLAVLQGLAGEVGAGGGVEQVCGVSEGETFIRSGTCQLRRSGVPKVSPNSASLSTFR
jgi:hypothetical protein